MHAYDNGGNILSKTEYAYTTGTLGTALDTITYGYSDSYWKDLLTSYDGQTLTSDNIGNLTNDGTWSYTWQHGRQLSGMTAAGKDASYTYDAEGRRIGKHYEDILYFIPEGGISYTTVRYPVDTEYFYLGDTLSHVTMEGYRSVNDTEIEVNVDMRFTYDAVGPLSVNYNGAEYFYLKNAQGDVTGIVNAAGTQVVAYTYDAWGKLLSTTGSMAGTLGEYNPLRYRSYVYDTETGLYYLNSRYYNPETGRFINADNLVDTEEILGGNLFVYCANNPINYQDPSGHLLLDIAVATLAKIAVAAIAAIAVAGLTVAVMNSPSAKKAADTIANGITKAYATVKKAATTVITQAKTYVQQKNAEIVDKKVRATVKEDSKNRYWSATVKKDCVDIGRPLTYNQAVQYVASGKSVFAVTQYEAKAVARAAGGTTGYNNRELMPEIDAGKENTPGYYYHFHTYNRKGGHVYYLFP